MIYADKISFNKGDQHRLNTIVRIHLHSESGELSDGWYYKETINQWLHEDKYEIKVEINPFPKLIPVDDGSNRYVRSDQDSTKKDNLLKLEAYTEPE